MSPPASDDLPRCGMTLHFFGDGDIRVKEGFDMVFPCSRRLPDDTFSAPPAVRCGICGSLTAHVRASEVDVARLTGRAHVDCAGHSQYRGVQPSELPPTTQKER